MTVVPPLQSFDDFEAATIAFLTPPYRPKFGLLQWEDQEKKSAIPYEWQVTGLFPRRQTILWFGESQSGKSFSAFDACVHVAQGKDYQGKRTRRGGVVYCFVEKGIGARNRMKAFRKVHDLPLDGFPLAATTKRFDIFASEETVRDLAKECIEAASRWDVPLDVITIDTHDKASPGASEIDKKDVSTILARYELLRDLTGAAIWIIGHSNSFGSARGSLVLYNAIETVISISVIQGPDKMPFRDANGRIIREAIVRKQSEGEAGTRWKFVLPAIEVGTDPDGEAVTSCVVSGPSDQEGEGPGEKVFTPTPNDALFLRAMIDAIDAHGVAPPPMLGLPQSIAKVVHYDHVKTAFWALNPDDGNNEDRHRETVKKALQRARERLQTRFIVSVANPYIWLSGKPVKGIIKAKPEQLAVHLEDAKIPDEIVNEAKGLDF